jgi:hypothetical protein
MPTAAPVETPVPLPSPIVEANSVEAKDFSPLQSPTAVPPLTPIAATSAGLADQAGLWFLGAGMSLALALLVWARARRKS